jgi:Tol biopolymer transport system component
MNQVWPKWSPDGREIAFHGVDTSDHSHIWVAPVGGGPLRQFTRGSRRDLGPQWDPLGKRIAFASNLRGSWDVWLVSVATGEERQLTTSNGTESIGWPNVWSPDGREIVFASARGAPFAIWIVSVEDWKERQVTSGPGRRPGWSPTGDWILYEAEDRLWRVRSSGGDRTPLPVGSHAGFWSRDGKKIYFHLARDGVEDIFDLPADGRAERRLTDLRGKYGTLEEVVTDGQHFYFSWLERVGDLWVMDVKAKS